MNTSDVIIGDEIVYRRYPTKHKAQGIIGSIGRNYVYVHELSTVTNDPTGEVHKILAGDIIYIVPPCQTADANAAYNRAMSGI